MAKNIERNIPDAELSGVLQVIAAQGWIVISMERESGGWTVISVSPDDPEAPQNVGNGGSQPPAGGGGGASSPPAAGAGGATGSASSDDAATLARTIFGEARGESDEGKEAVANVVVNRLKSGRFPRKASDPKTIAGVCLERLQFSCWNANDPNSSKIANLQKGSSPVFDICLAIAEKAVADTLTDRTDTATHYYADSIAPPSWAASPAVRTVKIGHHLFFKNVA